MAGPNVGGATLQQKEPFSIKRFFRPCLKNRYCTNDKEV